MCIKIHYIQKSIDLYYSNIKVIIAYLKQQRKKIKRLNCCTVTYLICQYERLVGVYNLHSSNIYLNYQRKAIQEYEESTSSFHINLSTDCTYWKFGVRRRTQKITAISAGKWYGKYGKLLRIYFQHSRVVFFFSEQISYLK